MAEGERVRDWAPVPGWPSTAWCRRPGPTPVLSPQDEALGVAQPGGVEHAHSCMMPDAVTPTDNRRSDARKSCPVSPTSGRRDPTAGGAASRRRSWTRNAGRHELGRTR